MQSSFVKYLLESIIEAFKANNKPEEEGEESNIYVGIYKKWRSSVKNFMISN
jgi:hypothetical protein